MQTKCSCETSAAEAGIQVSPFVSDVCGEYARCSASADLLQSFSQVRYCCHHTNIVCLVLQRGTVRSVPSSGFVSAGACHSPAIANSCCSTNDSVMLGQL